MQTLFNRYSHGLTERHKKVRFHVLASALFVVVLVATSGVAAALIAQSQVRQMGDGELVPVSTAIEKPKPRLPQSVLNDEEAPPDTGLQKLVEDWTADRTDVDNEWSVVVQTLDEEKLSAAIDSGRQYETASVYKLLMTYPLFQLVPLEEMESRMLKLEDKKEKSIAECLDLMLRVSDNPCGEAVAQFITYKKADHYLHEQGYRHTNLNREEYMVTTAGDTAAFLADLYEGRLFTPAERERVLSTLKAQQVYYGIPSGCSDCTVMNKTGDWNGVRHDAGIVQHDTGAYVIAIFSKGGSYAQFAELTTQVHEYILSR